MGSSGNILGSIGGGAAGYFLIGAGPYGFLAGAFIGSLAFGGRGKSRTDEINGYPVQKAMKGPPVPVQYGTTVTAGNVIWLSDFTTYEVEADSGGKGGMSGGAGSVNFRRSFLILLCHGKRTVSRIWIGDDEISLGESYSYGGDTYEPSKLLGVHESRLQEITVFEGDGTNDGLADIIGTEYSHHKWDCCVLFENYDLGASQALPNFLFEVTQTENPLAQYTDADLTTSTIIGVTGGNRYKAGQSFPVFQDQYLKKMGTKLFILPADDELPGTIEVSVHQVTAEDAGVYTLGEALTTGTMYYEDLPKVTDESLAKECYCTFDEPAYLRAGNVYCFILDLQADGGAEGTFRVAQEADTTYDGGYADPDFISAIHWSSLTEDYERAGRELFFETWGTWYGDDANPAAILQDLATNRLYSIGMPAAYIDTETFEEAREYWEEKGFGISLILDSQRPFLEWCEYILSHCGGFMYWHEGKLCLGVWKDEEASIHITRDDLALDDSGEGVPVTVKKRDYSETANHIVLLWTDRTKIYEQTPTAAKDEVDIRVSGKRRMREVELLGIHTSEMAEMMKWRYLLDSMYRFNYYSFALGPKHQMVRPGQVVLLSDGFQLSGKKARITSMSESQYASRIDVEAVDDISALYPDTSGWNTIQRSLREEETVVTSDDLAEPVVTFREDWFEQTLYLSLAPESAYTQGWLLFVSRDDATYEYVDRVAISAVTGGIANAAGTIVSGLESAVAPTWRGDESVLVSIGTVTDLRTDITDGEFFGNRRLAKIGDEIVAYKTCEETETEGIWRITGLIRGLLQSNPCAHAAGETFRTLGVDYAFEYVGTDIGSTLYFKALPYYRNVAGNLADVTASSVTVMGNPFRPYGAALVRLTESETDEEAGSQAYSGAGFTMYWNLCAKTSGFNVGPMDGGGEAWVYGDAEAELVSQGGVPFGEYTDDPALVGVDLVFRETDGSLISQRSVGVMSSEAVVKATDLGGLNPAECEVWPRYALRATREESLTADDGS